MSARRLRHQVTGCRLKGRRRRAEGGIASVMAWARGHPEVEALAVLGSYAYGRPRMASDLDLTVVASDRRRFTEASILRDGCRILHDPAGLLRRAMAELPPG